ncbi:MAG TPA: AgmX/PglI C-terminal domain-containing protein [Polyangiaceae bacterium]|jgi:hypothetical protein
MRSIAILGLILATACGGGDKPAENPQGGGGAGPTDAGAAADVGPTTTTTILMGDAGELQGSKLTTTQGPVTLDGGSESAPRPNAHDRDPGRTQQDLMTIIKSHRDEARACYDAAEKKNPGMQGNLDITFKLDPKGKVVETGIDDSKSDMHDPDLVKCIGDVIRRIPWAPSPRGFETTAQYPFNFHPHHHTP